jgi:acid phosphatase (class A)
MKKIVMIVAFAMMTVMNVKAQDNNVQPYYELDQMPKLIEIMPAPPAFDSPEFANDIVRYGWGKQQREDEERLELAIADAEWDDLTKVFLQWKDAFGLEISEMGTPEIYKLMVTALATTDPMRKETKAYYHRERPFERFNDTMPSHEEDDLRGEGSYPSGHSLRGWGITLLLAQIAPERAEQIFSRGWDYCNSRVIVGAHWQSDVDASRTAASVGFCKLQSSEALIAQMKKAQQEYQTLTEGTVGVRSAKVVEHPAAQVYRTNGVAAKDSTSGIVIQNGQKVVRK